MLTLLLILILVLGWGGGGGLGWAGYHGWRRRNNPDFVGGGPVHLLLVLALVIVLVRLLGI